MRNNVGNDQDFLEQAIFMETSILYVRSSKTTLETVQSNVMTHRICK